MTILKVKTNRPQDLSKALYDNGNIIDGKTSGLLSPLNGDRYYNDNDGYYILPFENETDAMVFKLRSENLIFL